jgi:hypothetical protein
MKRLIRRAFKAVYRRMEFIRAPIRAEFSDQFKQCISVSFDDVRVAMEDLVGEVFRLQEQVAELRAEVIQLREEERSAA